VKVKRLCAASLSVAFVLSVAAVFAQPAFKVVWKQGIILGLLVPPNTTKAELTSLVQKFRKARQDRTLPSMIPPVNTGLVDKYANFIVFIFSDPQWATPEKYKSYEAAGMKSKTAQTYLDHIAASYWYDLDGKEYGGLGHSDGVIKSKHYKKLF